MSIETYSNYAEDTELQLDKTYSINKFITDILEGAPATPKHVEFCYKVVEKSLTALINYEYSSFDAQTTSNCCHGLSLLVRDLIASLNRNELPTLLQSITSRITNDQLDPNLILPSALIDLAKAYILTYIRFTCPVKGIRSSASKLKEISPAGTTFCFELVKQVQLTFSNRVAFLYGKYLKPMIGRIETCGIPIRLWGRYASPAYLRKSSRGVYFTSSLYSLQVCIAHLILTKAKIAIVNDIYNSQDELTKRDIRILQGTGIDGFEYLGPIETLPSDSSETVVVFGGCAYNDDVDFVIKEMDSWLDRFPNLVLAGETFYPQFPRNCDHPTSQDNPITPEEKIILRTIDRHHQVGGVSACNPTFYLLNHIYPSSLKQILANDLPFYRIPKILTESTPASSK